MRKYLFKSDRLGFRNWKEHDQPKMGSINRDPKVMEFFPSILNQKQTDLFIHRMKEHFRKHGFCYFAVDHLQNNEFIGFIGFAEQIFNTDFSPCVDVGWRLAQSAWGVGLATEGAKRCLEFAFNEVGLSDIKGICPQVNSKSESVMKKIGMQKVKFFKHPLLANYPNLENCVLYEIKR